MKLIARNQAGQRFYAFRINDQRHGMTSDPEQAHEFADLVELAYAQARLVDSHNQLSCWEIEEDV